MELMFTWNPLAVCFNSEQAIPTGIMIVNCINHPSSRQVSEIVMSFRRVVWHIYSGLTEIHVVLLILKL